MMPEKVTIIPERERTERARTLKRLPTNACITTITMEGMLEAMKMYDSNSFCILVNPERLFKIVPEST